MRSLTLANAPGNAARKQARKRFCPKPGALGRDTWGKNTTKENQAKLNHRPHRLQSWLLPFFSSDQALGKTRMSPCHVLLCPGRWHLLQGPPGLQRWQMKVGRRRWQPLFEALLKPQRQEDAGMVVRDLLP